MKEFIDELISKDLSFDEIRDEFSKFGYSDDYEVYSKFTKDDYDVRDEFLSYIERSSSNIDELRRLWGSR
ncbi:TPA: hypothetical protein U0515_001889 [Streptococcus suis]|uniref:hypothetical protein n=1 Tax=Streptococcus suis TaxID=1307 RepID=UPI0004227B43|nr:hypothetical protein [Streptococcus suis]MCK3953533.1 hypothetical protein [Streptococcus suis]MCK3953542.1 hypothetical protein [Streptococcus suis]MCK4058018.1 hypothetical protein [Streptococcus suis]HEL1686654.1 hypothetical protein [Streptococcus suis]HEL2560915.1 hypothetical protein [Streptococcus suis]